MFLSDGPQGGLTIFDIENKEQPKILSQLDTPGGAFGVTLTIYDLNYAYIADRLMGTQIIKLLPEYMLFFIKKDIKTNNWVTTIEHTIKLGE